MRSTTLNQLTNLHKNWYVGGWVGRCVGGWLGT